MYTYRNRLFISGFSSLALALVVTTAGFAQISAAQTTQTDGAASAAPGASAKPVQQLPPVRQLLIALLGRDSVGQTQAILQAVREGWGPGMIAMALEVLPYSRNPIVHGELNALIAKSSGLPAEQTAEYGVNDWYFWLWNQNIEPAPDYAEFKADLFRLIDPRFETYFRGRPQSGALIRLDEVRWGGVRQDGIPPLRDPKMLTADAADYLADDNVVFGIELNGDARAYPKRILAWHEMFVDTIGGVEIAGVYCTLCGTVIPYRTSYNGSRHQLGTSGFLYRSNKLMYDKSTQSLWSTSRGEPVIGPLAGKGIRLAFESMVTTTWGEWKRRHPQTTVLSLDTGHDRDYGEGVAYAQYFGNDALMFNTPFKDKRLANKQEILALRFAGAPDQQLAIDTDFLAKNPLYAGQIGLQRFVVLTDSSGANRVFDPGSVQLTDYDGRDLATDDRANQWQVTESALIGPDERRLPRLPYYRAFWFGWRAAFPQTKLVK